MEQTVLEQMQEIPKTGYVLAYTREKVIFKPYQNGAEEIAEQIKDEQVLEIHCFNDELESRAIYSASKETYITHVISDALYVQNNSLPVESNSEEMDEYKYIEKAYLIKEQDREEQLQPKDKRIELISYLDYTENGMIEVKDYRLGKVEQEG